MNDRAEPPGGGGWRRMPFSGVAWESPNGGRWWVAVLRIPTPDRKHFLIEQTHRKEACILEDRNLGVNLSPAFMRICSYTTIRPRTQHHQPAEPCR